MTSLSAGANGFPIDRELPAAIHAQISDQMRARIASGEWPSNYRLKSEPELASELGVSRGTLRRAITTLTEEGMLRQVRGRGTFVTSPTLEPGIAQKLSTLSEDFARQGVSVTTEVLEAGIVPAHRPVASLLDISAGQGIFQIRRLRRSAQGALAYLENSVRADLVPGIESTDFEQESLFGVLETRYGLRIGSGRRTFSAVEAPTAVAEALELTPGSPVQYLEQVTYLSDGRPIEYSDVWINSRLLRVTSLLSRR